MYLDNKRKTLKNLMKNLAFQRNLFTDLVIKLSFEISFSHNISILKKVEFCIEFMSNTITFNLNNLYF